MTRFPKTVCGKGFQLEWENLANKKPFHFERVNRSILKGLYYSSPYSDNLRYRVVNAILSNSAVLVLLPLL